MSEPLRITPRAKTVAAKAHEKRFIKTTALLAKQFNRRVVVSIPARKP
jgi:hypothetical protein